MHHLFSCKIALTIIPVSNLCIVNFWHKTKIAKSTLSNYKNYLKVVNASRVKLKIVFNIDY